jgi:hypothetical protein
MKDKRFLFGLAVTLAWLFFSSYMILSQDLPTKLNEWGDFFAGFFAPLAFLWLVLGYMQQGDELRHSTEALRLQAKELKSSVEQQSQLVAVSREQVQNEVRALEEERERRKDAARPKFVPQSAGGIRSGNIADHKVRLVNVGSTVTKINIRSSPSLPGMADRFLPLFSRDETIFLNFQNGPDESLVSITYIDADGLPGEVQFTINPGLMSAVIGDVKRVV